MTAFHSPLLRPAIALFYGALCHACFALGVGTMVVMMFFGMSRSLGALDAPSSWIANVALLAQFPVMHSFLLTDRGQSRARPAGSRRHGCCTLDDHLRHHRVPSDLRALCVVVA